MSSTHLKCVCTFPVLPLPVCPVLRVALRAELQVADVLCMTPFTTPHHGSPSGWVACLDMPTSLQLL
jgi:hypothetical protein